MSRRIDWSVVESCKHDGCVDSTYRSISCGTPYCEGYTYYCRDCHTYVTRCQCGFLNGNSGWSEARYRKFWHKKEASHAVA